MKNRINDDLKQAMRSKDKEKLMLLRSLKSDMKNFEIDKGSEITDSELINLIQKAVKSRQQSYDLYIAGNRKDLADVELKEIEILKEYLPEELSEEEIIKEIDSVISEIPNVSKKDMGKIMKILRDKLSGRVDGKTLSSFVKAKLS
jgi:uncharacterized protein YqeY